MASDLDRKVKFDVTADTRNAISSFKAAGQSADQLGNKVKQAGEKGKQGLDKMSQGAQKAKIDMAAVAVAIQATTAQVAGMAQQILDFDSKLIALDKTIVGLESQEIALRRSIEDLNEAVAKGTISQKDYQRSLEDINLAYKNVQLESKNVEAETRKLGGEFVTFGINAIGTTAQVTTAFVAMGISGSGALSAIVVGIKAVSAALWTVMKHPVFLAITAGILAWELGLKSIVENLTGIDDLGIFSNLQKTFEGLTQGESSMQELDRQTAEFGKTVEQNLPVWGSQAEKLDEVGKSAERAGKKIKGLTIAQEQLMRSGGFRAGGGTSLSEAIHREADEIDSATARTLVAASLHEALKVAGIKGSLFGRNISGEIFNRAPSASSFSSASRVNGLSISGSGQRFTGIRGLTRSTARRRRNRNPLGRLDKLSVRIERAFKEHRAGLSKEFGLDIIGFTGTDNFGRNRSFHPQFGNNSGLGRDELRNAVFQSTFTDTASRREEEARRRFGNFRGVTAGLSVEEGLQFLEAGGFGSVRSTFDEGFRHKARMQEIIQARNFFRMHNVDFDGMSKMGLSGLLNIKEFGYREMNEQLAFQGKEQFQTMGT